MTYSLLHEIARHGVRISETLSVAIRSLDAMQHHRERFCVRNDLKGSNNGHECRYKAGSGFGFQLGILQGSLQRSEANTHIQNKITLVALLYNRQHITPP